MKIGKKLTIITKVNG